MSFKKKKTSAKQAAKKNASANHQSIKSDSAEFVPELNAAKISDLHDPAVPFPIVALGASAGGLESFEVFFQGMPSDCGMAFVLVVHLDPTHVSLLPELVQKKTDMKVRSAQEGMRVRVNSVYVIPPNNNLSIFHGLLHLTPFAKPRSSNLPIDHFFCSLAKEQGRAAICVVLSGTGSDGTLGLRAVKEAFGMAMVQEAESAKYDGMPRNAIATELVDVVCTPANMPKALFKLVRRESFRGTTQVVLRDNEVLESLNEIYVILRKQTQHDFALYKENTICRRIERRMNAYRLDEIQDYVEYLRNSPEEVDILFKELLIGVTNFFRDPQVFELLSNSVFPRLLAEKPDGYTLRVWVAGCSTGEEAYSIAIALHECMGAHRKLNLQMFATDIDEEAINVARTGLYPASIEEDVSEERLSRYFISESDGQYRVNKTIRAMLVFACQNVIKDPPFTKLDVLSCRNLMIYLGPKLQKRLLPIFHFGLITGGILILGTSESVGQSSELFGVTSKKWKIFESRRLVGSRAPLTLQAPSPMREIIIDRKERSEIVKNAEELSNLQLVESILAKSETPPCIVINAAFDMIYVHGQLGQFFEPAQGKASTNALKMARSGLKIHLAAAIRKANVRREEIVMRGLHLQYGGKTVNFELSVKPILGLGPLHGLLMVIFRIMVNQDESVPSVRKLSGRSKNIEDLESDLEFMSQNLQASIEEFETSNEELKFANEELQSTNEELQSTNEEMETSKEELQSLNEESATVNTELQSRVNELSNTNDDMKNLLDSTAIATLFLDLDLCVRRFTPKVLDIIPLAASDSGRPVSHFASKLVNLSLTELGMGVLVDLVVREVEVESVDGLTYSMKVRPYRTINNVVDGVVMTFEDITQRKETEGKLLLSEEKWRLQAENLPLFVVVFEYTGKIQFVSDIGMAEVVGSNIFDNADAEARGLTRELAEMVFRTGKPVAEKMKPVSSRLGNTTFENTLAPVSPIGDNLSLIFVSRTVIQFD
ncbi:MAG: two-component system CheB/CheR fusion protein [Planctomycetota bacterium]|jgi:two-component system CheB/CheR fusion protein